MASRPASAGAHRVRNAPSSGPPQQRPQSARIRELLEEQRVPGSIMLRRPKSALSLNLKVRSSTTPANKTLSYDAMRNREEGWNADFVKMKSLDASARGSGIRAAKNLRKTKSDSKLKPLKTRKTRKRKKKNNNLEVVSSEFSKTCDEIKRLWEQLHIPTKDRVYFKEAFLTEKKRPTATARARVKEQHQLLLQHKATTIEVLKRIKDRENNLMVLRKSSVEFICGKEDEDDSGDDSESNSFKPAREIVGLQRASIVVVEAIVRWRSLLWRDHAFNYMGMNYLIKMQTDARFVGKTIDESCKDTLFFTDCELLEGGEKVDVDALAEIVKQEAATQIKIRSEKKSLTTAGYYVPLLRWSPDKPPDVELTELKDDEYERDIDLDEGTQGEEEERKDEDVFKSSKQHLEMLQQLQNTLQKH